MIEQNKNIDYCEKGVTGTAKDIKVWNKEQKETFESKFEEFIKKWCDKWYPHLIDNDENDGEKLRQFVRDNFISKQLHDQEIEELNHNMEYLNLTSERFLDKIGILKNQLKEKDNKIEELSQRNVVRMLREKDKETERLSNLLFGSDRGIELKLIEKDKQIQELQSENEKLKAQKTEIENMLKEFNITYEYKRK